MMNNIKISACLVVYNEDKIIARCLNSIKDLADEIIVVHDGECTDQTLNIAKQYTDKIFIQPHTGDSSLHRVFSYECAQGEWIFQIDADEYLDQADQKVIRELVVKADKANINGYSFKWEMWNGKKAFQVKGFQKDCLFRQNNFHYLGITHGWAFIDGKTVPSGLVLHHRPAYNNICWASFFNKLRRWMPIHARFFFPNLVTYQGFNIGPEKWIKFTEKVRKHPGWYLLTQPLKMFLGQLKNGLYSHVIGWQAACQQYIYYFSLYWRVWKMNKKSKSR